MNPVSPRPRILALRLSALGDVLLAQSAMLDLRTSLPEADITWVIDERFRSLAEAVPNVKTVAIRKPTGLADYFRFRRALRGEKFDTLLAMQAALRVNLLYPAIRAARKIGFDTRRARDLQRLFINDSIERRDEHLLDGFRQFVSRAGASVTNPPRWPSMPAPPDVIDWWEKHRPQNPHVVVQVGASKLERCWSAEKYGELARRFAGHPSLGVVLTGGASRHERNAAEAFEKNCPRALNLAGATTLEQLRQILRSALVVISPDTAAVHLARAEDVPVVGLYAVARPALSGPYQQTHYTVDKYAEAVATLAGRDPAKVDWHFRVHQPGAMDLIAASEVWAQVQRALFERSQSLDR